MTVLYWICFIFLIVMCYNGLCRAIDGGFKGCNSCGEVLGKLADIIIVIAVFCGIIYFYLH